MARRGFWLLVILGCLTAVALFGWQQYRLQFDADLRLAVAENNPAYLTHVLASGANPYTVMPDGETALSHSIIHGKDEVFSLLWERAQSFRKSHKIATQLELLHASIRYQHRLSQESILPWLAEGKIRLEDYERWLDHAANNIFQLEASKQSHSQLRTVIQHLTGLDEAFYNHAVGFLQKALDAKNADQVIRLLYSGVPIEYRNEDVRTDCCDLTRRRYSLSIRRNFKSHNMPYSYGHGHFRNSGRLALLRFKDQATTLAVITAMLDMGRDVNHEDAAGRTLLMYAAAQHDLAVVGLLLERSARVNVKDVDGRTALLHVVTPRTGAGWHQTIMTGRERATTGTLTFNKLLAAGANPNACDKLGWTSRNYIFHWVEDYYAKQAIRDVNGLSGSDAALACIPDSKYMDIHDPYREFVHTQRQYEKLGLAYDGPSGLILTSDPDGTPVRLKEGRRIRLEKEENSNIYRLNP